MAKFKNVTGEPLYLGRSDGSRVGDGEHIEVEGAVKELDDAYLVGPSKVLPFYGREDLSEEQAASLAEHHGDLRLFPKATWSLVKAAKPARPAADESSSTDGSES